MGLAQIDTGYVAKAAGVQEQPGSKAPIDAGHSQEGERKDGHPQFSPDQRIFAWGVDTADPGVSPLAEGELGRALEPLAQPQDRLQHGPRIAQG